MRKYLHSTHSRAATTSPPPCFMFCGPGASNDELPTAGKRHRPSSGAQKIGSGWVRGGTQGLVYQTHTEVRRRERTKPSQHLFTRHANLAHRSSQFSDLFSVVAILLQIPRAPIGAFHRHSRAHGFSMGKSKY